MGKYF
jgi:hypothetical protein